MHRAGVPHPKKSKLANVWPSSSERYALRPKSHLRASETAEGSRQSQVSRLDQRLGVDKQIVTMALRTAVSVAASWSTPSPLAIEFIAESPLQTRRVRFVADGIDGYRRELDTAGVAIFYAT
jgi:hypothetical protein